MTMKLAFFEAGKHAINVLEISHWSFDPSEMVVWMKNGHSVRFEGLPGYEVEKSLKAFLTKINPWL